MRINSSRGSTGVQSSASASKGKGKGKAAGSGGDSVKVSDAAGLREKALTMLSDMSAVRMERIEEIRGALEEGSFKSDSRKIAKQIVSNALAERSW
ncbi:MAG: flagellar biosynthesis anti-sigma factor FlgM [Mariprofundus sp.]|nr:flagellar biosynthesis anti-sigma factor FlgM [Mariprofundus sp.]